jgi:hypothetical protein
MLLQTLRTRDFDDLAAAFPRWELRVRQLGLGNHFIKCLYQNYIEPRIGFRDSGGGPFDTFQEAVRFAHAEVGLPWKLIAVDGQNHVFVREEE